MIALMSEKTNGAREALGEIYRIALGAKTMVLMAQGKPMHKDWPETGPDHPPSWDKSMEQMLKAEVFLEVLIEKLDRFAKSFDLPDNWWTSEPPKEGGGGEEQGTAVTETTGL
jgi:hypothetical protein